MHSIKIFLIQTTLLLRISQTKTMENKVITTTSTTTLTLREKGLWVGDDKRINRSDVQRAAGTHRRSLKAK